MRQRPLHLYIVKSTVKSTDCFKVGGAQRGLQTLDDFLHLSKNAQKLPLPTCQCYKVGCVAGSPAEGTPSTTTHTKGWS